MRPADLEDLSADQARAVAAIGSSPWLVQPLCAPAGAGKTHSLRALRTAAARAGKDVLVLAPTGKAVDQALHDDAGDRGYTIAKALHLMQSGEMRLDRHCVIVVDEASMVATPDLNTLLTEASKARVKTVLVGDPYQLATVKARGGMFAQLCDELPWTQRLSEVWRMRDPDERQASLALRCAPGAATGYGTRSAGTAPTTASTPATTKQRITFDPDAEILTSFPGVGALTGARILGEIGDDRSRFAEARNLRAYAGSAPVTRASGKSLVVMQRKVKNQRLAAAGYTWAFAALTASPHARAHYDRRRAVGDGHPAALRNLYNRFLSQMHHCLSTGEIYQPERAFPQDRTTVAA